MALYKKISLIFAAMLAGITLGGYLVLSGTLIPAFDDLEARAASQDLARARNGLVGISEVLASTTIDWGQWDEAHLYMQGKNPGFAAANLEAASLTALDINLMVFFDSARNLRWGMYVDIESGDTLPVNEALIDADLMQSLQEHDSNTSAIEGLVVSQLGPMLISSRPIVRSDTSGSIEGTIVVGRLLDERRIARLSRAAEVDVNLVPADFLVGNATPAGSDPMFGPVETSIVEERRTAQQALYDLFANPVAVLGVSAPRDVYALGQRTARSVLLMFAGLGAATIIALAFLLRHMVLQPVATLRNAMTSIESSKEMSSRVHLERDDEIGDVAKSFNTMLDALENLKRQHVDQSFKAGMAEVAAGVLHNVRNSLMPVLNNVAAARDLLGHRSNGNVERAICELESDDVAPDRRSKLLQFLQSNAADAAADVNVIDESLAQAMVQLDQVASILNEQEKYTNAKPVLEKLNLTELLTEAVNIVPVVGDTRIDIAIDDSASDLKVRGHRTGLLQVIGNVLVNAYEAIRRHGTSTGRISISAAGNKKGADHQVQLTIKDNGVGVDSASLEHLFDRGFSTKEGSGGLGLHWSANALASMNGKIVAHSDGRGRGTEFQITLEAA